jgi:hypothetical protein
LLIYWFKVYERAGFLMPEPGHVKSRGDEAARLITALRGDWHPGREAAEHD